MTKIEIIRYLNTHTPKFFAYINLRPNHPALVKISKKDFLSIIDHAYNNESLHCSINSEGNFIIGTNP